MTKLRQKLRSRLRDPGAQAAVEYLLTLAGVFLAMVGTAALFGTVIRNYLGWVIRFIRYSFFQ